MASLLQDFRYGFRMLFKNPGVTVVAVLALGLGIGANTAIFSVVNGVLLRPLTFPQPERIVQVFRHYGEGNDVPALSVPMILNFKAHGQVFDHLAAYQFLPVGFNLSQGSEPERISGIHVSGQFFDVLGVKPVLGRAFLPEEDQPGGPQVAVLSNTLWRDRFGADPNLIGKTITLSQTSFTVIGIMPRDFEYPASVDLWAPLQLPSASRDPANLYNVIGRLRQGVTRPSAEAQLTLIENQFEKANPDQANSKATALIPLQQVIVGDVRAILLVLLGAVGFVLLIACANVANLLLARATARRKEVAIRTAMGATRWRLIRQLLTESMLLGVAGGALGLLLAFWGIKLLLVLRPGNLPRLHEVSLDPRVLGFTLLISLATGILFGFAPALRISRTDLNASLKEGSRGSTQGRERNRLRSALVAGEIALSMVLLVGAVLLIQTFARLREVKPGFDPRHVLTFEMSLPQKYGNPAGLAAFVRQVIERIQTVPGVQFAATVTSLPLQISPDLPFNIEGRPTQSPGDASGDCQYEVISADYFRAMGIPLVEGRYFTDNDRSESGWVVIINSTMAKQFWPNQDPIGQRLTIGKTMGPQWSDPSPREVVGVVGDVKDKSLDQPAPGEMFVPYTQVPAPIVAVTVQQIPQRWAVRTTGDPLSISGTVKAEVLAVDSSQPLAAVAPMEQLMSKSIAGNQFNMLLLGIFAALALLLAAVGIYGVMSYSVAQRAHDIGIRMALGARASDVLKLVVGQGMLLAAVGVAIGGAGALGLTRLMKSMLFGVSPGDPAAFVVVSLMLAAVALLASYLPARRATKVDPIVALRYE
ncbi:MAG: ABC transporter permease [Terriglobia bacterium]